MRLHSLSITAFGPFADTVEVDFDQLGEAGLFLLSGATGAGKTSILDAACFALYGEVPGDRNAAKRLRSDQAPPGTAPRIVLEATLGGRRFRLTRSPAWERPKKRGQGTTMQQASVVIQERLGSDWLTHTTRLDEAGHLITELLGMNLTQFCQVAMLPQGRFQAFLRARSEDRHQLLQQLFRSQRFADIESWLAERRRSLRRACATERHRVSELAHRLSEVAGQEPPEIGDGDRDQVTAIERWSTDLLSHAKAECVSSTAVRRDSEARVAKAADTHATTLAKSRLQGAYIAAVSERDDLAAAAAPHHAKVEKLDLDGRARSLAPLVTLSQRSASETTAAAARVAASASALGLEIAPDQVPATLPDFEAQHRQCLADLASARALAPTVAELGRLVSLRDEWATEADGIERSLVAQNQTVTRAENDLTRLQRQRQVAHEAEAHRVHAKHAWEQNATLVTAHRELESLTPLLIQATDDLAESQAETLILKEEWLAVREARLNGMAVEIARGLAVGGCCPVCGSANHPHPARAPAHAPDADSERATRAALDDAEAAQHAFRDRQRELSVRVMMLTETVGQTAREECLALDQELRAEVDRLASIGARAELIEAQLAEAEATLREAGAALDEIAGRQTEVRTGLAQVVPTVRRLQTEIDRVLTVRSTAALEETVSGLSRQLTQLEQAIAAQRAWESCNELSQQQHQALTTAALEAGFADPTDAAAAILTPSDRATLEAEVASYDDHLRSVLEVLDSADHRAAAADEVADPQETELSLAFAQRQFAQADACAAQAEERLDRLRTLHRDMAAALTSWTPILADLDLTARLAALTEGSGPDNSLQMRLSAYVLAYRLSQVVTAANDRLLVMSDQRYSLEHTERRGAGERRGGLSLRVRDDWSGEPRDPATLSGGETFVVSLSLALGLADVISHEVGGAELDTLFVDEGFGALDADTLDDVMDTLDSLRDGGRVVGIVSHVLEMRHRIPTRLHVSKRRTGSTVALIRGS
jgi:DNA repair protein SbcC/Rad50